MSWSVPVAIDKARSWLVGQQFIPHHTLAPSPWDLMLLYNQGGKEQYSINTPTVLAIYLPGLLMLLNNQMQKQCAVNASTVCQYLLWNVVICSKTSIEATMSSDKHMSFAPTWRWLCLDCLQLVYGPLQRSDYNTALFPFLRLFGSVIYETRSPFTSKSSRHGLRRCTTAKVILWARNDLELITLPKRLQIAIFIIDVPTKRYKSRTTKSSRG